MSTPAITPRDPLGWNAAIALAFLALCCIRITTAPAPYFDELHYIPAARAMLDLAPPRNLEHPPLGKQMLALGMALLGDKSIGWRIMPMMAGTLALFAAMRAMWLASYSRAASLLTGFFLTTGFPLLVQSRIAMLDIFMAAFMLVALWMCAGAMHAGGRWRLALAGIALGAAMASKWNAVPLAVLPGLAFFAIRWRDVGFRARNWHGIGRNPIARLICSRQGAPAPGISLAEAGLWLGVVPLAVYLASYWIIFAQGWDGGRWDGGGLVRLHRSMFDLQSQLTTPHPYQSNWLQWVSNSRAIWYLYEPIAGARRGVLLLGNPLTMLAGLPALAWCAWAGLMRGRRDAAAVALLYAASLGMWIIAPKPVQFYYHYLLPGCFLLAALALASAEMWKAGRRALPIALCIASAGLFAWFFPILTAAPLEGARTFERWIWLDGWV